MLLECNKDKFFDEGDFQLAMDDSLKARHPIFEEIAALSASMYLMFVYWLYLVCIM